ncbi:MAG: hydrolase, partial [Phenylobacterium zucineum]
MKVTTSNALPSLARVDAPARPFMTIALVQTRWHEDALEHQAVLEEGVRLGAEAGANAVFLPELTLSRYPADEMPTGDAQATAEDLLSGPTLSLASRLAKTYGVWMHASLFERNPTDDRRGLNTAILVNPQGELVGRTRKLHIPVTEGYFEDLYFAPGPAGDGSLTSEAYPVYETSIDGTPARIGLPTCWDEWFPEVAREYSLRGAEILVYPTAIGSEPDHPDFDTQPLWQQVIVGNGIANGTFMVVPNRYGFEGSLTFYGSSFISDPYGRILVQASRDADEVLVA